jgi:hypothetical protein
LRRPGIRIEDYLSARSRDRIELSSLLARCAGCQNEQSLERAGVDEDGDRTTYICPECGALLLLLVARERVEGGFDSLLEIPGALTILEP